MNAKAHLQHIRRYESAHPDRPGKMRLDRNERAFPLPDDVFRDILGCLTQEVFLSYPEISPVYDLLAESVGLPRECLLLSHASDAALKAIFEVYVGPGDEAVILRPTYAMYEVYPLLYDALPVPVAFDDDLGLPLEKIVAAITPRTRIVCLPNPNQPVERVFSPAEIAVLLDMARRQDFLLVVDEAYHHFCPETAAPLVLSEPNLVVTRTFSKAFGMAGLRAGLTITCPQRIAELRTVKPISEINGVAVAVLSHMLGRMDLVRDHVRVVDQGRSRLLERAARLGIPAHGRASNSVLLELADGETVRRLVQAAAGQGFLVKGPFEAPAHRHLRITLADPATMDAVMDVLAKELQ